MPQIRDWDERILELKYAAPQIRMMSPAQVSTWSKALLLKIHVITGWTIPDNELLMILIDQFEKKLIESYGDMNPEEIEYAFRSSGTTVKDWGKSMNLSLIDQVLLPYLNQRFELSAHEERNKDQPPEQRILTDEQLHQLQRGDVEEFYQRCRRGIVPYKLPDYFKAVLVKDKLMKEEDDLAQFFSAKLGAGIEHIYVPVKLQRDV